MSQIARIFVVLNLLVAAGFFFAASTFLGLNNDYKRKFEGEEKGRAADNAAAAVREQKKDTTIKDLESQLSAAKEQNGTLSGANTQLTSELAKSNQANTTKDGQIAELTRVNGEHAASSQRQTQEISRLTEQNTNLDKAQRDAVKKMEESVTALNDEQKKNLEATNKIADLEKNCVTRDEAIAKLELKEKYAKSKGIDFENLDMTPAVSGVVVNADNAMKLVVTNVGSANGIHKGSILDVVRGATYIGRVHVDTVYPNTSAGILKITAAGQQVMVGDKVTNTLN